jgi:hypothetical protein
MPTRGSRTCTRVGRVVLVLAGLLSSRAWVVGCFLIQAAGPPEMFATGVGCWMVGAVRGQGIASRCVGAAARWLFGGRDVVPAGEIGLLHTVGDEGSCRVAQKCGYALDSVLAPLPPKFPDEGHRHLRKRPARTAAVRQGSGERVMFVLVGVVRSDRFDVLRGNRVETAGPPWVGVSQGSSGLLSGFSLIMAFDRLVARAVPGALRTGGADFRVHGVVRGVAVA